MMLEPQEVTLGNGEVIVLYDKDRNEMAHELIRYLPENTLREWLKTSICINEETKQKFLELEGQNFKSRVGLLVAFYTWHKAQRPEQQQEEQ